MIRADALTPVESLAVINRCFRDRAFEAGGPYICTTEEPGWEIAEQRAISEGRVSELEEQIIRGRADKGADNWVRRYLRSHGIELPEGHTPAGDALAVGLLRALAEQQRAFQHRLSEGVLPFVPTDPLFVNLQDHAVIPTDAHQDVAGPTLSQLVDRYLASQRSRWTAKTFKLNEQKLRFVVEFLGATRRAASITSADVRAYRAAVSRLRLGHHVGATGGFLARQTEDTQHRISAKTASLHFAALKTLFRWAKGEGYIQADPGAGIQFAQPKMQKGKKPRRPFRAEEVCRLFSAPAFTGFRSIHRRFTPGSVVVRDAFWWIPVLAYYGGFRLGELVQLHVADIRLDGPVPHITVNETEGGEVGSGTEKHVKSEAGVRCVPLHPDVLALGFGNFVNARRKDHKARKRLFWEVSFGRDGQASSVFSKWFARLMDKVGLDDPSLVFHSFRHLMEDAFRNSLTPQYVTDRIIGHSDGKVSSGYGQGVSLEVAYEAVKGLKLPASIVSMCRGVEEGPPKGVMGAEEGPLIPMV